MERTFLDQYTERYAEKDRIKFVAITADVRRSAERGPDLGRLLPVHQVTARVSQPTYSRSGVVGENRDFVYRRERVFHSGYEEL